MNFELPEVKDNCITHNNNQNHRSFEKFEYTMFWFSRFYLYKESDYGSKLIININMQCFVFQDSIYTRKVIMDLN